MALIDEIKTRFRQGDALMRLLLINAAVFVVILVYLLVLHFGTWSPGFLGEDLTLAASSDPAVMLRRPWSIVTHMFTHIQFGHFLFNMVALYTMGQLFISMQGSKKLTRLYLLGGLSGYLLFAIAYNFFPVFRERNGSYVLGASAAVMAITVAAAVLAPRRAIYLFGAVRLEMRWLAAILVLLDLASVREGVNSGGHIGHIGGALFGLIYARRLLAGKDIGSKTGEAVRSMFTRSRMNVVGKNGRSKSDADFNMEKKARQERIDEILDRISKSGYESLSKEEKEFLFRNSQR